MADKKGLGAYYTPPEIAEYLVKEMGLTDGDSVLEPSVGDGAFLFPALEHTQNITALDINEEVVNELTNKTNIDILNMDFLEFANNLSDKKRYDIVLSNPPYLSFKKLSEEQRKLLSDILSSNKIKTVKQTNLWAGFVVGSLSMLKAGGKFAYVLPAEFLYTVYGKEIQKYILDNSSNLTIIGFKTVVFEDTQQDTILVYGQKKLSDSDKLSLTCFTLDSLLDLQDSKKIEVLKVKGKQDGNIDIIDWKLVNSSKEFRGIYVDKFKDASEPITNLADIKIGLTTGANNVFIVSKEVVDAYDISRYAKPLLRNAKDVFSTGYNKTIFDKLKNKNKKVFLLDFNDKELLDSAKKYIYDIEVLGLHKGYKLQNRTKWYNIPNMNVPDMFMLRRAGEDVRLISNDIRAMSTDNFHHIFLKEDHSNEELLVLSYTSIYRLSIDLASRSYGGGALEILSGDFNKLRVPKISGNPDYKGILKEINNMIKNGEAIYDIVKHVDQKILNFISLSEAEISTIYNEWKKLCKTRNKK